MQILVVEDDDIVRMLTVEVLDEFGYGVVEAEDAGSALAVLQDASVDLALMMTDVGLPDMDGVALANKAREYRPLLPILFASGLSDSLSVPEGMHSIGKPYSIDALREKVSALLAASAP